jgi:hypothetical protein
MNARNDANEKSKSDSIKATSSTVAKRKEYKRSELSELLMLEFRKRYNISALNGELM